MMIDLEYAAFQAWPAHEEIDQYGWKLRFAHGYTKRANSANAINTANNLSHTQIDAVETFYLSRSSHPIFRLVSFAAHAQTDARLAQRGYLYEGKSWVMARPLDALSVTGDFESVDDVDAWLQAYQQITTTSNPEQKDHLRHLLTRIQGLRLLAIQRVQGQPVCCGLGVIVGDYLGLFDIATHPDFQGQGLATELCRGLIAWGGRQGAQTAFLQVTASNLKAINVYQKLGFKSRYHYWYRVHPCSE